jgi:DivIVA domain-containing protein
MDMNPQRVRSAEFKTVRRGVDPDEVQAFLADVADELERAQNQATAMEARARAAVARLQEVSDSGGSSASVDASAEEAETISRTLLLAQRTADATVSDAKAQATRIVGEANDEAARTIDSTREMAAQMIDEARTEARRIGDAERLALLGEVDSLKARREFLESDVGHLETFLVEQRARLRDAASAIVDVTERVPGGLGEVRRPLLSASDDDAADREEVPDVEAPAAERVAALDPGRDPWDSSPGGGAASWIAESRDTDTSESGPVDLATDDEDPIAAVGRTDETSTPQADALFAPSEPHEQPVAPGDEPAPPVEELTDPDEDADELTEPPSSAAEDPTEALPVADRDPSDEFRFSFDDDRR